MKYFGTHIKRLNFYKEPSRIDERNQLHVVQGPTFLSLQVETVFIPQSISDCTTFVSFQSSTLFKLASYMRRRLCRKRNNCFEHCCMAGEYTVFSALSVKKSFWRKLRLVIISNIGVKRSSLCQPQRNEQRVELTI